MPLSNERRHAIVIGGSMGGLLAARVLSDRFERVTIIDRDTFPVAGENRRGVPQGRHTHGLLASGRQVLDRLFPGISTEIMDAGGLDGDLVEDARWFNAGGCLAKFSSGLRGLLVSRPALEFIVRRRTMALPNVSTRQNGVVEDLDSTPDHVRITGVKVNGETLAADLVLDASGRGSHSPQWLEALGYTGPSQESIEIALSYATCLFRRRREELGGDSAAIIAPTPTGKRGGVMLAQEGERWTVTMVGHFDQVPPVDLAGFIEYSRTIPSPDIYEVIRHAEPLCDPIQTRFPASVRRRYEKLARFPEGYLVFGDALSSFNPIYGQGMSVAALESEELARRLDAGSTPLWRGFFTAASKIIDNPWSMAAGNDLRMPEATGPRNAGVNFINWYMGKLLRGAHSDPALAMVFHKAANMLEPPQSVLRPGVVLRVMRSSLRPAGAPAQRRAMRAAVR